MAAIIVRASPTSARATTRARRCQFVQNQCAEHERAAGDGRRTAPLRLRAMPIAVRAALRAAPATRSRSQPDGAWRSPAACTAGRAGRNPAPPAAGCRAVVRKMEVANGSISTAEIAPPRNTAGIRSTDCPRFFSTTTLTAAANGAPNAISMPRTLFADSMRRPPANIQTIPAIAMPIASHVRSGIGDFSTAHASTAVSSGETASTIRVLAVDVSVSASMKQTNIVAHMQPDSSPACPRAPALRRSPGGSTADKRRRTPPRTDCART